MTPWLQQFIRAPATLALVARAKQTGTLNYDEVAAVLSPETDPDRLSELVDWILDQTGCALVDDEGEPETADYTPPPEPPVIYHHDQAFEWQLRVLGVTFTDALVSYEADGCVFNAELLVPGEHALAAWLALRNAVPQTGLWPVIEREQREPGFADAPYPLDPAHRWFKWQEAWRRDRNTPPPELTPDIIRADARARITEAEAVSPTPWTFRRFEGQRPAPPLPDEPDDERDPPVPNLAKLFSNDGPFRAMRHGGGGSRMPFAPFVRLKLYPTTRPWEVFAYAPYGGWNDAPWPDEQLAMLRHWHELYGVEVVSRPGDWYELFVPRPPRTRHQAALLCAEMGHFGEETFYAYGSYVHPDPIEAVRTSHYWYFWWD